VTDASPQLDYAPAPSGLRSARARGWAIAIGAALLLLGMVWVTPRAVRRVRVAYWQQQCLNYAAPADQVIYSNNPTDIVKLLAPPTRYEGSVGAGQAFFVPPSYGNYRGAMSLSRSVGTPFLHQRVTPQGKVRLVAVEFYCIAANWTGQGTLMTLMAATFDPSGTVRGPRQIVTTTTGDGQTLRLSATDTVRVFAGQPDPNDPSHFTIDYDLNGTRHTLDGWLKDDGVVAIESRD